MFHRALLIGLVGLWGWGPAPAGADDLPAYTNPVYAHDFPDPHVIREGNTYYAYATQSGPGGFQLLTSPDLVHWSKTPLDFPIPWSREHYWAPEVVKHDGKYFMTYSARDPESKKHHIAIATATSPGGPFAHQSILVRGDDNKVGVIDATIVFDGEEPFLFYSEETPRRIVARPMSPDLLKVVGEPVEIVRPTLDWEHGVTEAPTIVRHGGLFHLIYSGGPYQGNKGGAQYAVGHASAKALLGPYDKTPRPILASVEGSVYGPGHQSVVESPGHDWWMLYHAWDNQGEPRYGRNRLGRTLRLDRVEWRGEVPTVMGPSVDSRPAPRFDAAGAR